MLQCSETQREHYEEAIESYDAYEPFNTSSKSTAVLHKPNWSKTVHADSLRAMTKEKAISKLKRMKTEA